MATAAPLDAQDALLRGLVAADDQDGVQASLQALALDFGNRLAHDRFPPLVAPALFVPDVHDIGAKAREGILNQAQNLRFAQKGGRPVLVQPATVSLHGQRHDRRKDGG